MSAAGAAELGGDSEEVEERRMAPDPIALAWAALHPTVPLPAVLSRPPRPAVATQPGTASRRWSSLAAAGMKAP